MPNLLMVRMKPWINWVSTSNNEAWGPIETNLNPSRPRSEPPEPHCIAGHRCHQHVVLLVSGNRATATRLVGERVLARPDQQLRKSIVPHHQDFARRRLRQRRDGVQEGRDARGSHRGPP
jgi:hypothetical protein